MGKWNYLNIVIVLLSILGLFLYRLIICRRLEMHSQKKKWDIFIIVIVLLYFLGQSLYHHIRLYRQIKVHSGRYNFTRIDIANLTVMIEMYKIVTQLLPSEKNIWNELSSAPSDVATMDDCPLANWKSRHNNAKFESGIVKDHWGNPMIYRINPNIQTYELYSIGPNAINEAGKGDDIKLPDWHLEDIRPSIIARARKRGLLGLTQSDICDLTVMIEMYKLATGSIPSENNIWNELSSAPSDVTTNNGCQLVKWKSSITDAKFEDGIVKDHWGNPMIFRINSNLQIYELYSIGPNGIDEASMGDDIKLDDWDLECFRSIAKSLADKRGLLPISEDCGCGEKFGGP